MINERIMVICQILIYYIAFLPNIYCTITESNFLLYFLLVTNYELRYIFNRVFEKLKIFLVVLYVL